eukprot:605677_1
MLNKRPVQTMDNYYLTPIIGGVAGLTADVCTHPISTVKTRMQVQGAQKALFESEVSVAYRNPFQASLHMIKHEGPLSFWQGIGAVIYGAPFASALYFGGVEVTKLAFDRQSAAIDFASGVVGQLCGSLAWVPMDVLKERCQIQGQIHTNVNYNSAASAARSIIKNEGILGIYRAYFIHQFTWAPFNGFYWMFYGQSKNYFGENSFLLSSCIAGTLSSFITSPLDLVKTRMQVQRANPHLFPFNNSFQCALRVYKTEGIVSFFDGVLARVLWLTPRYVIAVSMFDALKLQFSTSKEDALDIDELEPTL